jgi:hypothetical protein
VEEKNSVRLFWESDVAKIAHCKIVDELNISRYTSDGNALNVHAWEKSVSVRVAKGIGIHISLND